MMRVRGNAILLICLTAGLAAAGLYGCAPAQAESVDVTYYYLPG